MLVRLLLVLALFVSPQATQIGTIEGTVMRQGNTDPIPDVQITVGGNGLILLPRQAQAVLDAAAGGLPVSEEILQAAQYSLRNGGVIARGGASAPLRAVTDAAGHFVIQNVPAGNTVIRAQLQGYFDSPSNGSYPTTVVSNVTVTAQKTAQIQLSMIPGSSVSGRVVDPGGKPLADSIVQILQPLYQNGVRTLVPVDLKASDDRGEYRLSRLPPGEYYISASPPRTPNTSMSSEVPLTTLHPSAIEMATATPLVLKPGDEQSGANIQIRTAASVKVSGKVTSLAPSVAGQRGAQGRPTSVALVPRGPGALPDPTIGALVPVGADGSFEIPNIPAGAYDLIARAPLPANAGWGAGNAPALAGNPWGFGKTPVDVRGQNVSDISVVVRGGFDVTGHLIVDGKPASANVRIGLTTLEGVTRIADAQTLNTFGQIATFQPAIGADGSFTIPLLPEGKYRLQVGVGGIISAAAAAALPLPPTAYVADIRQGAVSVYDNGLIVGGEAVNPFQVLVNTDGGSIEGTVAGLDRKPVPAMTVVLVPAENRRQNPALYKNVRSDAQGHFLFSVVAPGQYKVFAWENVSSGAWQNVEFLSRFEERGISANVMPGTRTSVEVRLIRNEAP